MRSVSQHVTHDVPTHRLTLVRAAGAELGEQATLVQFSSAFCAPCRATRQVLTRVTGLVPGVRHVEIDAEENLHLVRAAEVTRTPTTLVLDEAGREITRAAGAPTKNQVLRALTHTPRGARTRFPPSVS